MFWILLAFTVATACGTRTTPISPAGDTDTDTVSVNGRVVDDDGKPVTNAVVIVSPNNDDDPVLTGTDAQGRFVVAIPPGEHAVSVATEQGFAVRRAAAIEPGAEISLVLDPSCARLEGRARGDLTGMPVVQVARYFRELGDHFAATVGPDGVFSLCLPDGTYGAWVESPHASRLVSFDVPGPVVEMVVYPEDRVKAVPDDAPVIDAHSVDVLLASIGPDVMVIGLGEATHGTADFVIERAAALRRLIAERGVRALVLEVGAADMFAIDDYVQGADVDLRAAVAGLGFWIWDTEEMIAVFEELRRHNVAVPEHRRVHALGFDVQRLATAASYVLGAADDLALEDPTRTALQRLIADESAISPDDRVLIDAVVARLVSQSGTDVVGSSGWRRRTAARVLQLGLHLKDATALTQLVSRRDRAMADLTLELARAGLRVCLWGHNGHLSKERRAHRAMGEHLHDALGDAYHVTGFLQASGTFRAWDPEGAVGVIVHDLEMTPAHQVESVLLRSTPSAAVAYFDLDRLPEPLATWIATPRYVRSQGSVIELIPGFVEDVREGYDALAVVRKGRATTPTATGVRTAK